MKKKKDETIDAAAEQPMDTPAGTEAAETAEAPREDGAETTDGKDSDELGRLKAELAVAKDTALRATADFQNLKRRSEKEKTEIYRYANEKLLVDLLPFVDNIDRALSHAGDAEGGLADGLRMIRKNLSDLLEKNGVEAIEAVGMPFDPELHHAVQMVEAEGCEPQHVMEEYQKGYKLNGKVIRHSMVKVAE